MADTFTVTIATGGEAFEAAPGAEVARILRKIADQTEHVHDADHLIEFSAVAHDVNGNNVGSATWT